VLVRQRPGTSKGVVFMTLEDATGIANIIVWPKVFARWRRTVMTASFLAVRRRLLRRRKWSPRKPPHLRRSRPATPLPRRCAVLAAEPLQQRAGVWRVQTG
jgi:DNA polymerase III alpha subunit